VIDFLLCVRATSFYSLRSIKRKFTDRLYKGGSAKNSAPHQNINYIYFPILCTCKRNLLTACISSGNAKNSAPHQNINSVFLLLKPKIEEKEKKYQEFRNYHHIIANITKKTRT
jgi:hypothetical protein